MFDECVELRHLPKQSGKSEKTKNRSRKLEYSIDNIFKITNFVINEKNLEYYVNADHDEEYNICNF